MIEIRETESFIEFMDNLRDIRAKAKIAARIERLSHGNFGDVAPVGEGLSEMRVHFGPGYRVYFVKHGSTLIVLLAGGDKSTQDKDIRKAKILAASLEF